MDRAKANARPVYSEIFQVYSKSKGIWNRGKQNGKCIIVADLFWCLTKHQVEESSTCTMPSKRQGAGQHHIHPIRVLAIATTDHAVIQKQRHRPVASGLFCFENRCCRPSTGTAEWGLDFAILRLEQSSVLNVEDQGILLKDPISICNTTITEVQVVVVSGLDYIYSLGVYY